MESTNINSKNTWKVAAIILIVVAIALAGTTVFFAIKNRNAESSNAAIADKTENTSNNGSSTKCPVTERPIEAPTISSYLVIKEWDVKFAIPYGLEDVTYKTKTSDGITIVDVYTRLGNDTGIASNNDYAPFMDNALVSIRRVGANDAVDRPLSNCYPCTAKQRAQ